MKRKPVISVIIPVKKLSYYLIFECLPKLDAQTFEKYEVIVLSDYPNYYDKTLLKKYNWLTIIYTKNKKPGEKRNIGIKHSKGEYIAFIDDDAYPPKSWLKKAYSFLRDNKNLVVCGPGILPENALLWEKIFDEGFAILGSGFFVYRFKKRKARFVNDYPFMNFFINKNLFINTGGIQKKYWPGEDSKLCNKLVYEKKVKILYDPSLYIFHHRRNTMHAFFKQHVNYGIHRGTFFIHGDKNSKRIIYIIPSLFTLYLLLLSIYATYILFTPLVKTPSFFYIFVIPFQLYFVLQAYTFFSSLYNTKSVKLAFAGIITIFLIHIVYGVSFIKGCIKGSLKQSIYDK